MYKITCANCQKPFLASTLCDPCQKDLGEKAQEALNTPAYIQQLEAENAHLRALTTPKPEWVEWPTEPGWWWTAICISNEWRIVVVVNWGDEAVETAHWNEPARRFCKVPMPEVPHA